VAGAKLLTAGTYEGLFYRPTVLADTGPGIPDYDQEVFGPVACVTRFSTLDEALELAPDTEYVLALGISTTDVATGLALAERIPTGTAHINDQMLRDDAHVPSAGFATRATPLASAPLLPTSRHTPTPDGPRRAVRRHKSTVFASNRANPGSDSQSNSGLRNIAPRK
jgi:hypothetical protein